MPLNAEADTLSRYRALPSCVLAESLDSISELEGKGWTVNGNPTIANTARGKAVDLDGTGDSMTILNDEIGIGADSFCVWIYPEGWGGSSTGRILDNNNTMFWVTDTDDKLMFSSNGASSSASSATDSISLNQWQFVCAARDSVGTSTNMYVNGVLSGTANQNAGGPEVGTTDLLIGDRSAGARAFNGTIQNLLIFNRVLSAQEISDIYYGRTFSYNESLVSHWDMSEVNPQDLGWKGNGNDGTGTGLVASTDIVRENGDWGVEFNGSDEIVDVLDNGELRAVPFSVYVKFKWNLLPSSLGDQVDIVQTMLTEGPWWSWLLQGYDSGGSQDKVRFITYAESGGGNNAVETNSALSVNTIYSTIATIDSSYAKYLYLDGIKQTDTSVHEALDVSPVNGLNIGAQDASNNNMNGVIYDIKFFSTALTGLQVEDLTLEGR